MRRFIRFYLLKVLLVLIVIELIVLVLYQNRNHAPIVQNESFESFSGKEKAINVLRNDVDEDEDSLFIKDVKTIKGISIKQQDGKLVLTISRDYVGEDSIKYVVSDGDKETKGFVKFIIKENKPPIANPDHFFAYKGESEIELDVLNNDYDAEGDSFSIHSFLKPAHGVIVKDNSLVYKLDQGYQGVDSFSYVLSDQLVQMDTAKVIIDVKEGKFSSIPYAGNLANYTRVPGSMWNIQQADNNKSLYLSDNSKGSNGLLGAFCILKNRYYNSDLNISLVAKIDEDLEKNQWCDYAIVFSYRDENNYSYAFLNSHAGSSGIFNCVNGQKQEITKVPNPIITNNKYAKVKLVRKGDVVM